MPIPLSAPTADWPLAKVVILRHEIPPFCCLNPKNPPHSIHLKIKSNRFRREYIFYMNECKKAGETYLCKTVGRHDKTRQRRIRHLRMVSMRRERLIRPTVQACRHDKTRSVASGICARCRMRRERLIRLLFHRLADLIQRRRIINGRQSPGSRPSQIAWIVRRSIFPDAFLAIARQTRRAPGGQSCQLAVHQRHNRLLLRVRHLTVFRLSLSFGMTNATATCPFSASSPQPPPLRQRPDDWRYSLQFTRPQPMPGNVNHIISTPQDK